MHRDRIPDEVDLGAFGDPSENRCFHINDRAHAERRAVVFVQRDAVEANRFGVNIIPHTQHQTTFGTAAIGDPVNLEIDMLARYVARLIGQDAP